jgi:putative acyl-CoA dehydrogenase
VSTHVVTNQVPPLVGHSLLTSDPALEEGLRRWAGPTAYEDIAVLGELAGRPEAQEAGDLANRHTPVLRTHAPTGERLDEVDFHISWHQLMDAAVANGLTAGPWTEPPAPAPTCVARPASSSGPRWRPATCARCR